MIIFLGILLGIFIITLMMIEYSKTHDFLHPIVIFLFLEFIRYVPGLLILEQESSVKFTTTGSFKVFVFEIIYILFALFGMNFANRLNVKSKNIIYDMPTFNILVMFLIGFISKIVVISKLGGLSFVLSSPQLAYQMQSHGFGIYTILYKFMQLGIIAMCEKAVLHKDRKRYVFYSIVMTLIYMLSFLIYTNRTPAFIMLLIVFFIINFEVHRFNIERLFNWKVLIIFLIILFGSKYAAERRTYRSDNVSSNFVYELIKELSYDGRDMFVYNYFGNHDKWLGKGYLNVVPSITPGVREKPSTDDGIYLVNLIRGYSINPNENYNYLPTTTGSVPFSTPGYMYANFGIFGIIIGGFIIGIINMLFYKYMLRNLNAFNVALYFIIIYQFGLSTGKLVPAVISILFIIIFKKIFSFKIVFKKRYKNNFNR